MSLFETYFLIILVFIIGIAVSNNKPNNKPKFIIRKYLLTYKVNNNIKEVIYEKRYEQLSGYWFDSDSCLFIYRPNISGDKMIECDKVEIINNIEIIVN